jgi:hypothetical protein
VLRYGKGEVRRKTVQELRNVRGGARVEVEHIWAVGRIALFPRDIGAIIDQTASMVPLVDGDTDQLLLSSLSLRSPRVEECASYVSHAILSVAPAMEEPDT